jgi:hypothetical protein
MSKLFMNALVFGIALQMTCYLFWAFNVFGGLVVYPISSASTMSGMAGWFDISAFSVLVGVGGSIAIGIAGLLLRQGTYAIYAVLLWAIGNFFPFVRDFFLTIPNTISALIPSVTNPNPTLFPINPIMIVISSIFAFGAFMYMFGLVFQREM